MEFITLEEKKTSIARVIQIRSISLFYSQHLFLIIHWTL